MFKVLSLVLVLALAVNAQSRYRKLSAYGGDFSQQQKKQLQPELMMPELRQPQQQQFQQQQQPQIIGQQQELQQIQQQPQLQQPQGVQFQQSMIGQQQQPQLQQPQLQQPQGVQFQQQQQQQQQPQLQQPQGVQFQQQQQQQPQIFEFQQSLIGQQQLQSQQQPQLQQPQQFQKLVREDLLIKPSQQYQQQQQQLPVLPTALPKQTTEYQSYQQQQPQTLPVLPAVLPKQTTEYQSYQQQQPQPQITKETIPVITEQYQSYQQKQPIVPQLPRGIVTGSPIANPCIGREAGEKYPHPTSTRLYIVCLEESQYQIMQCAPTTFFNKHTLQCENTIKVPKGCASNPCLNGGKCIDLPLFKFKCECAPGSAGDVCDKTDACLGPVNPCGADSICVPLPFGSPVPKYCVLDDGNKIGLDGVTQIERNPCLDNTLDWYNLKTTLALRSAYIHCEGHIPFLKFCAAPLELNVDLQKCDWTADVQQLPQLPQLSGYGGYGQQIQVPQTYGGYQQQQPQMLRPQSTFTGFQQAPQTQFRPQQQQPQQQQRVIMPQATKFASQGY